MCNNPEIGTLRETFFVSQLSHRHELRYPNKADFLVNGEMLFEVGAERKTARQIQDTSQPAYLAIDNIEHGHGQRIPLWLFGFVYGCCILPSSIIKFTFVAINLFYII